ncbi:hypothetical protein [Riemerella anatipestifer]|uniref:hypothetical protein n=1 Tax=Riemerella anatipestifer TaxID=34085 RepID=UPI00208F97F0|nr:hypothetical protein [Riemerella anatipestifer]MCO4303196.1 hypothetical protein [Riemerella anatipestifer]MCO7353608.1 hypothetical protein [Riemerella anatipestifer]MCQ4039030.1 hypothetical protein [Riemerella anatipestifer]MCT6759968.1 hypothetical protein [Riemerella anatipestifer]MCT6764167.1 hypothetical protein [Riemerella anatipestifer]
MAFRLNATKPNKNAGLPTPKSELYLLYVEDIISMPTANPKGIITEGNIVIADGRRFHVLYLTPSTQTHNRDTEGDVDSRGWKKKITGHYPGDEIEINEFVKNNTNQGFVIVSKTCNSEYKRIYGSKCNPLYFTGAFVDDSEKKGYELTFEQEFADNDPVLFYNGNILVDEDALNPSGLEAASSIFVKLDASNITPNNKNLLKKALDIGEMPTNAATIDEGDKEGTVYTKTQADKLVKNIANSTLDTTKEGGVNQLYDYRWNIALGSSFSMFTGMDFGTTSRENTSFTLNTGYFGVTQGTGDGAYDFSVTDEGIKLLYSLNTDIDSEDEIHTYIGIIRGKICLGGVDDLGLEDVSDVKQLVVDKGGYVYSAEFSQDTLQDVVDRGGTALTDKYFSIEYNKPTPIQNITHYISMSDSYVRMATNDNTRGSKFNYVEVNKNFIELNSTQSLMGSSVIIQPDSFRVEFTNYNDLEPVFLLDRVNGARLSKYLLKNADGDMTFDKIMVYKADGSLGVESKPKIKKYVLKNDTAINSFAENSDSDLVFTLEAGKLYRIKMCIKYKSKVPYSTIFFKLISYDLQKEINFCTDSEANLIGINSGNTTNPNGISTHSDSSIESRIVEGMIKIDKTITVNNSLKLEGSHPSQTEIILEKGTYIELEEII